MAGGFDYRHREFEKERLKDTIPRILFMEKDAEGGAWKNNLSFMKTK